MKVNNTMKLVLKNKKSISKASHVLCDQILKVLG